MDLWKEAYLGAESAQQVINETRMETGDSRKSGVSHTNATLRWTRRKTWAKTVIPWLTEISDTPLRLTLTPCALTPRMRTRSCTFVDHLWQFVSLLRIPLWWRPNSAPSLCDPPSWLAQCVRADTKLNKSGGNIIKGATPVNWFPCVLGMGEIYPSQSHVFTNVIG